MIPLLTRHILVWITNGILWCIVTPFGIYNLCTYYKYSGKLALNKRHHATVVCLVVFVLIFWTIERGIGLIWSSQIFGESFVLTLIHYTIFPFTIYGIVWSLVWRYWLVYYDISLAISTSHSRWKSILNPKNDETAWFIVNKKTFGNEIWTFKCCIFLWLIISISSILFHLIAVLDIYSPRIATLLDGAMNMLSFIILYIIWYKTPKFEDKLWIRFELKVIIYAYSTLYIWYFVATITSSMFQINEFVFNVISSWIAVIITNIFVYICTRWILDKFVFDRCGSSVPFSCSVSFPRTHLKLYQILTQNDGFISFMDHLIYEFSHECLLSFIEMVQWKASLNSIILKFAKHYQYKDIELILLMNQNEEQHMKRKSYSIDLSRMKSPKLMALNSLSAVSLKKDVSMIMKNDRNSYKSHILLCPFPDKVPLSSIVSDWKYNGNINETQRTNVVSDNDADIEKNDEESLVAKGRIMCDYKMKAYGLYSRYICNGCEMEINIDSQTRNELYGFMCNLEQWMNQEISIIDLYVLFDEAIEEMYKLMQDSFKRFKQTKEFIKLDDEILSSIKIVH